MIAEIVNPDEIRAADIVVGIPSYCEADTINTPVSIVSKGLMEHFADKSAVIVNVDNHSPDGTREAFFKTETMVPKIHVTTPPGILGKGRNIVNLFEIAVELRAKAILMVDADLKSIIPNWIENFVEPVLDGYDYVVPIYIRHKYDGTITNNIAYPLLRTLYGLRVRQPIGGDFGISGKLARAFLVEKTLTEDVYQFGIDIWMTTIAIGRNFKVCQTFMGTNKEHRPKDPAEDLGPMFSQVVGTIFQQMIDFEYIWKDIFSSRPSIIYGFGLGQKGDPEEVKVTRSKLFENFISGFEAYGEIWEQVLDEQNWRNVNELQKMDVQNFYYRSDLWARILFDFAIAYRTEIADRQKLLEALIPFYFSRTLSFVNKTTEMDTQEAELYLENINRVFEAEKYYLMRRWDEMLKVNGKTKAAVHFMTK